MTNHAIFYTSTITARVFNTLLRRTPPKTPDRSSSPDQCILRFIFKIQWFPISFTNPMYVPYRLASSRWCSSETKPRITWSMYDQHRPIKKRQINSELRNQKHVCSINCSFCYTCNRFCRYWWLKGRYDCEIYVLTRAFVDLGLQLDVT